MFETKKKRKAREQDERESFRDTKRTELKSWALNNYGGAIKELPALPEGYAWYIGPVEDEYWLDEPFRIISVVTTYMAKMDLSVISDRTYGEDPKKSQREVIKTANYLMQKLKNESEQDLLTGFYPPKEFPSV